MQSTGVRPCLEKTVTSWRSFSTRRIRHEIVASVQKRPVLLRVPKQQQQRVVRGHYAQSPIDAPRQRVETVGEVMTKGVIYTVSPETTVIDALQLVVEKRITGMPVVNHENQVVGVVSDFDLLAIDLRNETRSTNIFPSIETSWEVFHDLQNMIAKSEGKIVEDVMTDDPVVVRAETSINAAALLLMRTRTRRLPVVDREGTLIGLLTRRDIVTAALAARQRPDMRASEDGDLLSSVS